MTGKVDKKRCEWAGQDPLYIAYHDTEWGVPVYDSKDLFAKLILDGFQAGLSWLTILKKRDNFYQAFDGFDPEKIASYTDEKISLLMKDKGIIRNKLKINSTVTNARIFLDYESAEHSFSEMLWSYTDGLPKINKWKNLEQVPVNTKQSDQMSKDLKNRGFKFVGTTICYAFMQAVGIVNDHTIDCFRYKELS